MPLSAGVRPEPPAGSSWWARAWGSGRGGSGTVGGTGWSEGPGGQQRGPGSEEEEAVGPFIGYPLMTCNVGYGRGSGCRRIHSPGVEGAEPDAVPLSLPPPPLAQRDELPSSPDPLPPTSPRHRPRSWLPPPHRCSKTCPWTWLHGWQGRTRQRHLWGRSARSASRGGAKWCAAPREGGLIGSAPP